MAGQVFDMFSGNWEVAQMERNTPAIAFWRSVVVEYTKGNYEELRVSDPIYKIPLIAQRFTSRSGSTTISSRGRL